LAVIQAALSAAHGAETIQNKFSYYYMAREIIEVTQGMFIAVPPKAWSKSQKMTPTEMADHLQNIARQVNLRKYKKTI
jgi:hypothetical protein